MIRSATSARRRVLAVVIFCGVLFGSAAAAEAAQAPRDALRQALRDAHALVPQASASAEPASAAVAALARATQPQFWINSREADAAPYGRNVFTSSAEAVTDLQLLGEPSFPVRTTAVELILAGDRGLAEDAIAEAHGGSAALLATARKALSTGNRQARAGRLPAAVGSYANAWQSAYGALTRLVASELASFPSGALAAAAEQALVGTRFGMAGPMIEQAPTAAHRRRQAGGLLRWLRGVSVLRRPALGHDRRAIAVRDVLASAPDAERCHECPAGHDVHVLRIELPEPLRLVRSGRGVEQPPRPSPCSHSPIPRARSFTSSTPRARRRSSTSPTASSRSSSTVDPHLIAHKSWTQLASALTDTSNVSTQAIAGEAEVFTAELCEATGGSPQSVCSSTIVQQYEAALPNPARAGRVVSGAHRSGGPAACGRYGGVRAEPGWVVRPGRHRGPLPGLASVDELDVPQLLG